MPEFEVEVTVTAKVPAENAGDAIHKLCESLRAGLGPDDRKRAYGASIARGHANLKREVTE